jgi:hypothetical protein
MGSGGLMLICMELGGTSIPDESCVHLGHVVAHYACVPV